MHVGLGTLRTPKLQQCNVMGIIFNCAHQFLFVAKLHKLAIIRNALFIISIALAEGVVT